jgi:hypothetical protein
VTIGAAPNLANSRLAARSETRSVTAFAAPVNEPMKPARLSGSGKRLTTPRANRRVSA